MAARRRSKRSPRQRDLIREKQAYYSMEIALCEHSDLQEYKTSLTQRKRSQKKQPSFNTVMTEQLQEEVKTKQKKKATSSRDTNVPHLPAEPHAWMARAANQGTSDLSWFMLFVMFLFAMMGMIGS